MTTTRAKNKKQGEEVKGGGRRSYYVTVFLFRNRQIVQKYSSPQKSRVLRFLQMRNLAESKIDYGLCRISYVASKGVFDEFKFNDLGEFRKAIDECTEPDLLRFIAEGRW